MPKWLHTSLILTITSRRYLYIFDILTVYIFAADYTKLSDLSTRNFSSELPIVHLRAPNWLDLSNVEDLAVTLFPHWRPPFWLRSGLGCQRSAHHSNGLRANLCLYSWQVRQKNRYAPHDCASDGKWHIYLLTTTLPPQECVCVRVCVDIPCGVGFRIKRFYFFRACPKRQENR